MGRLFDGVFKVICRICLSSMTSESLGCCCSPRLSLLQSCSASQYSGWSKTKVYLFASVPHNLGSQVFTHSFLLYFMGGTEGKEGFSWHWAVSHCGQGDTGKVKLFLFPSSKWTILEFLLTDVLEFLYWTLQLPQRGFMHVGVLCREDSRKLIFGHFDYITLLLLWTNFYLLGQLRIRKK